MNDPAASLPHLEFPEQLPVSARREDIAAALNRHQVIIVCGETGSGKTTQLPKIALAAGRGEKKLVGMTQPRRIAAKSVAARIAEETRTRLGGLVGWQVRFTDQVSKESRIKVMTDGILLAETQSDPDFRAYDTLILDEAHERSLNIDFLLGYLKTLLPRRPDLKLILSSATLEADRFSAYFNGAPVVEVSGRTYPVEVRYRPPQPVRAKPGDAAPAKEEEPDFDLALLHAVDELAAAGPGDILVFLPGEREIRETQEALRKHHPPQTEILPLYARLSVADQERVFQPHNGRRIVLSTNVAETSLTVPGIRYVVDTGLARVKRYSIRNKIEQLKVEKVSQAAARQRSGRCGRVAEGIAIRLYDEPDYLARPAYTTPELLRSSLAGVILRMKSLRLPEIDVFPFLDPPEGRRIRDGQQLLAELGALDERGRLTGIGKQLAHLPLDPRIGRMLIAAREKACLSEVLVIAAYLSVQDPRERPLEQQEAADQKHRRFADESSDYLGLLRMWQHIDQLSHHRKSQKKFREALKADFLSPNRVREWRDVYAQLLVQVKELGWPVAEMHSEERAGKDASATSTGGPSPGRAAASRGASCSARGAGDAGETPALRGEPVAQASSPAFSASGETPYAPLHQALLPGLLGNLGMLTEEGNYLGAREMRFWIFPGSGVKKKPKWLLAAEIVETKRVFARMVAKIEPEWIEHAARHLLKVSYSDPHWAKKPAHVAASMRATLYGLPVVNGRKVHYGPIDPVLSRELFLRGALVAGEFETRAPWFEHNRRLLEEIDDLAQRARNARLHVDEHRLYQFFDARVPEGIHNGPAFDQWRREAEKAQPRLLYLERADLLDDRHDPQEQAYPPTLELHGARYPLAYRFDPGTEDDGVTLMIPLAALNQIDPARCDWLVPGLLEEKITALIKSLPQSIRRAFVPVPEFARAAVAALQVQKSGLIDALAGFLGKSTGQVIPRDAWRPEALARHLHMNYRVQDEAGKTLAEGRDLAALREKFGAEARQELARSADAYQQEKISQWDFADLPETVTVRSGGRHVAAFPALDCVDGQVNLRLFDHALEARLRHRQGVARLLWLAFPDFMKQTERDLAGRLKNTCLQYALLFKGQSCPALARDVMQAAALAGRDLGAIRTRADFTAACQALRPGLPEAVNRMQKVAEESIAITQRLQQSLNKAPAAWKPALTDLKQQLDALVFPGFLAVHPGERLPHLPRYLKGMEMRLAKLANNLARDATAVREMAPLLTAWRGRVERVRAQGGEDPALDAFRWQLEELRVSLFAQELKTPEPVSVKRLEKRWAEIVG